jgi:HK97 family phage prohead protease
MTEILLRAFEATVERTTPETLSARLVPYGKPAQVVEITDKGVVRYTEEFARGAFDFQVKHREARAVAGRVRLLDEHEGGSGKLGAARALAERDDGLYGEFMVFASRAHDVEQLLDGGQVGVSIGFHPTSKPLVRNDGTFVRTSAFLHHVALVPEGAYPGAEVLSFRDAEMVEADAAEAARLVEEEAARARQELADWLAREKARNDEWVARTSTV